MRYFLKLGFLDGAARSRKLDYPLATLDPQNKFFDGYGWRFSALASLGVFARALATASRLDLRSRTT